MTFLNSSAFLIIDMQEGFISKSSVLCVDGAQNTIPACAKALAHARKNNILIYYVYREYAADGSNVEKVRLDIWRKGGFPLSSIARQNETGAFPHELAPEKGDILLKKPRFSAFFGTNLNDQLQKQGIETIILTGTTTPNCIRSTCYDALSFDYNVVIVEDCTSSRTPEVQKSNIADMKYIGARIISLEEFCTNKM